MLVEWLRKRQGPETTVICADQYKKMLAASRLLEKCCGDAEVTVSVQPEFFSGAITVECDDLAEMDSKIFAAAVAYSDNVEVYPLRNKKIRVELTFHKVTHPLKKEEK